MENITINKTWIQGKRLSVDDLRDFAFQGEDQAHTFVISGKTASGSAVPITGLITGRYLAANNLSVPLVGTISDDKAVVTLDAPCYALPGRFIVSIYAKNGDKNICIYNGIGYMFRTESERLAYPSKAIPDMQKLIEEAQGIIDDMEDARTDAVASIETKGQEVLESIPEDYSELSADVSDLKNNLTDATREIGLTNITGWQSGGISGGTNANIASAVANPTPSSVFEYVIVECSPDDVFTINANSGTSPKAFYFTDASYNVLTRGDKGSYTDYVIAAPETSKYLIINKTVSNTKKSYKGSKQNGLNINGVGSDNMIWSWMTYPGIVSFNRVRNKLYWGYTSADGYHGVAAYDFDTNVTVKNNLFHGQIDDHNSTAVHVCPDGTIICGFSTGHNYDYCMHIRRSSVPECIEQFDDDIIVAGLGETSYCQFASYGNRLYMFYRINNTMWMHRLSTDNGLTWSAPTQIVSSAEKMYIKIVPTTTETRMRILLFNNSTYNDSEIRQGFFDLTNGNIYNSDNSTLLGTSGLSITDFSVLIPLDSTLTHTRFFDAAVTAPGSPLIAYCVFNTGDDSEYRIFDSGNVTATFIGGYGLMNYYQLGMAWRGTSQIIVAHGVGADGGTDLIDLYDYANGTSTYNTNLDSVIRGSVPIRLARPIVDQAGKAVIWQRGYYNRSDYTDFNMDSKLHVFAD